MQPKNLLHAPAARLHRLTQIVLLYHLLVWLGTMLLVGNLAVLPLCILPRRVREPIVQWGISTICRVFLSGAEACGLMQLDLTALDTLNDRRRLLLVPNHPSMIDAFLVLSRVERGVCLMKASISSNLFLGAGAYLAGYVSNRHPQQMFRAAIDCVRRGNLLMIFPEGTRTIRQPVNPLQAAVALIGKKAGAPLQSILIRTNSPYLSKGWKIWRPPSFPLIYRAELGPVFQAEACIEQTTTQLQHYFESTLERSIDPTLRLRPGLRVSPLQRQLP